MHKPLAPLQKLTTLFILTASLVVLAGSAAAQSPTPVFKVVDANDVKVGFPLGPNLLMRKLGTVWVTLPFNPNTGFQSYNQLGVNIIIPDIPELPGAVPTNFYYTSADCTGTAYWEAEYEPQLGIVSGNTVYYGDGAVQQIAVGSYADLGGGCTQGNFTVHARPLTTFDLSTLNFVLPFKVVRE